LNYEYTGIWANSQGAPVLGLNRAAAHDLLIRVAWQLVRENLRTHHRIAGVLPRFARSYAEP
jgi:hypothetical protein